MAKIATSFNAYPQQRRISCECRQGEAVKSARLYAVDNESFLRRRIEWIKSLPHFEVVPTEAMEHRLNQLFSANPLREERRTILLEEERQQAEAIKLEQERFYR
jgi:hypothetical protein